MKPILMRQKLHLLKRPLEATSKVILALKRSHEKSDTNHSTSLLELQVTMQGDGGTDMSEVDIGKRRIN